MSKIALTPNASGSGTFTIASPNSDTDRVLTLPDSSATLATTNGITEADMWRLSTFFQSSANDVINTNFERVDDASFAKIGTGMSQSSGVWTFPSTGLYLVQMNGYVDHTANVDYVGIQLDASTDGGSTFDSLSWTFDTLRLGTSVGYSATLNVESFVNVTNTSNVKVRFMTYNASTANLTGSTSRNATWFKFIRLGDAQ